MQSWPNMKCLGRYYLLLFGFIYPYLPPKYNFCSYLALLTYIYHYLPMFGLALITLIWSYVPLIDMIWPNVPYSP